MPLPTNYAGSFRVNARSNRMIGCSVLFHQQYVDVLAADDDGVSVAVAGPNTTTVQATIGGALASGGYARFDVPRNVVVTVTHATAVVALSGVISGFDLDGKELTEAWSVTAGTASKVFTGKKAFKVVSGVTVVAAADASADTIKIGTGKLLGVDVKVAAPSVIVQEFEDDALITNGVLVAASEASTDDRRGTYTPNSAPNGALDFDIYVITDDPWNS